MPRRYAISYVTHAASKHVFFPRHHEEIPGKTFSISLTDSVEFNMTEMIWPALLLISRRQSNQCDRIMLVSSFDVARVLVGVASPDKSFVLRLFQDPLSARWICAGISALSKA